MDLSSGISHSAVPHSGGSADAFTSFPILLMIQAPITVFSYTSILQKQTPNFNGILMQKKLKKRLQLSAGVLNEIALRLSLLNLNSCLERA